MITKPQQIQIANTKKTNQMKILITLHFTQKQNK